MEDNIMIILKAKDMKDFKDVVKVLEILKVPNKQIDSLGLEEGSIEYELACESIEEQLIEIEEFLIGADTYNSKNICNADIRMFTYWNYLNNKITQKQLKEKLRKYSIKRNIEF
jgi:hypothetical protein